jgi:predicted transcriptional regulator
MIRRSRHPSLLITRWIGNGDAILIFHKTLLAGVSRSVLDSVQFAIRDLRIKNYTTFTFEKAHPLRKHNGMRPQDIAVLLKIIAGDNMIWQNKDLSVALSLSASEISESLNRSRIAGLIDGEKRKVSRRSLMEFLDHGLRYVFPAVPGPLARGIPTAHAHPFMSNEFPIEEPYIWPDPEGKVRGVAIEPLYQGTTRAIQGDEQLYKLLSLADVIRIGKVRERKVAIKELKKMILQKPPAENDADPMPWDN